VALVPRGCPRVFEEEVRDTLGVEVVRTNICGTSLIGVFVAMNNQGALLPKNIYPEERKLLEEAGLEVEVCPDRYTALGNTILVNGKGAAVSPGFARASLKVMEDVFDCEVEKVSLESFTTLGSIALATDLGGVIHPVVSDEEAEGIAEILEVPIEAGTVNRGIGFIRTGAIANSRGIMVGRHHRPGNHKAPGCAGAVVGYNRRTAPEGPATPDKKYFMYNK